jgi:8-oxo-dGTP diphosphatase
MTLRPAPQRFDTSNPHVGVSVAVFREGRVLLTTRTQPPFVGLFTLPGGHIESGETASHAALRELQEETGVKAKLVGFNQYVETVTPPNASGISRHFVILSFVGTWISGNGSPGPEAGEILWAEPKQIALLKTSPYLIEVVANAQKVLARKTLPD